MKYIPFIISALIHILFLIVVANMSFSLHSQGQGIEVSVAPGKRKSKEGGEDITVIPKLDTDATGKQCKHTYGGVGLKYEGGSRVFEVYTGYPADKAGIRAGDILYSKEDLRGEPGTKVAVTIVRDTNYIDIIITRDKICYDE